MGYIPIVINVCQWHIDYPNILILSFGGMIADMILASWDMLSDCFFMFISGICNLYNIHTDMIDTISMIISHCW